MLQSSRGFVARRVFHRDLQSTRRTKRLSSTTSTPFLDVSEEVREAVHARKPVVALETTIYTHGFPYPDNIALSSLLESRVREGGGVPATVGILNGVAKVGMSVEENIQLLESAGRETTIKVSRKDIGYICGSGIVGRRLNGGTTISGTLVLAHLAGIKVFATGGLGGVHKGGENSMDISADLTELGRTPMALVSSGCKSFLDIPRTLEVLETQGVGVGTFADGREGPVDFPAFWTRDSGTRSPITLDSELDAAAILHAQLQLPLSSGLLFANPISEKYSLSKEMMDEVMAQAVHNAEEQGITGSANTPFVLKRIREITENATVTANRALVESNVIRGTKVAVALSNVELAQRAASQSQSQDHTVAFQKPADAPQELKPLGTQVDVLVAGSIAIDLSCDYSPLSKDSSSKMPSHNTSNPAKISQSLGGVGQNVATASHYFGARTQLCSIVGDDAAGESVISQLQSKGLDTMAIIRSTTGTSTAQYVAVNDHNKDLVLAMADMRILEEDGDLKSVWKPHVDHYNPRWVIVDANWSPNTLKQWISAAKSINASIAYEPVSVEKSTRLLEEDWKSHIDSLLTSSTSTNTTKAAFSRTKIVDVAAPNELEVQAMASEFRSMDAWTAYVTGNSHSIPRGLQDHIVSSSSSPSSAISSDTLITALKLLSRVPCILTKLGARGVLLAEALSPDDARLSDPEEESYILFRRRSMPSPSGDQARFPIPEADESSSLENVAGVYMRHFPVPIEVQAEDIVSVNGVGDTFLGVLVAGLAQGRYKMDELITIAQRAAGLTLQSEQSVSPRIKDML